MAIAPPVFCISLFCFFMTYLREQGISLRCRAMWRVWRVWLKRWGKYTSSYPKTCFLIKHIRWKHNSVLLKNKAIKIKMNIFEASTSMRIQKQAQKHCSQKSKSENRCHCRSFVFATSCINQIGTPKDHSLSSNTLKQHDPLKIGGDANYRCTDSSADCTPRMAK